MTHVQADRIYPGIDALLVRLQSGHTLDRSDDTDFSFAAIA